MLRTVVAHRDRAGGKGNGSDICVLRELRREEVEQSVNVIVVRLVTAGPWRRLPPTGLPVPGGCRLLGSHPEQDRRGHARTVVAATQQGGAVTTVPGSVLS